MKKKPVPAVSVPPPWLIPWVGSAVFLTAYGLLLFHPDLHPACPENDTWNLPVRWSVLSSFREGRLPLWNPLSAFGIPWLATWQTEAFYPGTLLFTGFGLSAWNFSGILHLMILSLGAYFFLRAENQGPFASFLSAAIALMNGCAYNHLGSNSSMDTMAWIPWLFLAVLHCLEENPWGRFQLAGFFTLQVLAGYPQIIFYTLVGLAAYAIFRKGWKATAKLLLPLSAGLLLSAAQWIPSVEYFFINSARLPAVHDNPHFFLPPENLGTLLNPTALSRGGLPDYVVNPTFFYFNFYSGLLPLLLLAFGMVRWKTLRPISRFFLIGFLSLMAWALGYPLMALEVLHLPFPDFLEPAKCWVLANVFELLTFGFILGDLFPKPAKWQWVLLALSIANLLWFVGAHPLERNLTPPSPLLDAQAQNLKSHLGSGRVLVLPDPQEHQRLYTPVPDPAQEPLFKHFVPDSNYYEFLPTATFYGSTQPSWGALDAGFYFQYVFPRDNGALMDLLGVDLLYLPEDRLPPHYQKIQADGHWVLWKNPSSLGSHFFFYGSPQMEDRKKIFADFADGAAKPLQNLFLDPSRPASLAPLAQGPPLDAGEVALPGGDKSGIVVVTQNATPGWRAWVDGRPAGLYLADGMFQAVFFASGDKKVRLAYEPASFRLGLFLSLLALGGFLAGAGIKKTRMIRRVEPIKIRRVSPPAFRRPFQALFRG